MEVVRTIAQTRELIKSWKNAGQSVGLVPTMGYLHQGHLSLVEYSTAENDKTVVSIFVNPTQFSPGEDLDSYPRDLQADLDMCESAGVDLVFYPDAAEMYRPGDCTFVDLSALTQHLCGKSRPTHFRGVTTVVTKLFNITTPTRAYFGQKDAQQLAVIRQMVADLDMDIQVVACPIVREPDGLAKSSRNSYLTPEQRKAAQVISRAVFEGQRMVKSGERQAEKVITIMRDIIAEQPLAEIEYIEAVNAATMQKISQIEGTVLVAVAVRFGKTRLIDNFLHTV